MSKTQWKMPDLLTEQVLDLHSETFRQGMEAGMRRVWEKGPLTTDRLHALIRELDAEFNHNCEHQFGDTGCRRCGIEDPLQARHIGLGKPR